MKGKSIPERVMSLLTAAVLLSAFFIPQDIKRKAALVCACAALPEGGYFYIKDMYLTGQSVGAAAGVVSQQDCEQPDKTVTRSADVTQTPQDILNLMSEALKNSADDKRDGNIKSWTYDKSSATSIFGNVLVRNVTDTKPINIGHL